MTKTAEFTMAAAPVPFLEGQYFNGMCELAAAQVSQTPLFIPDETRGIFRSLFMKRVFGYVENKNGSYTIGNFDMKNKYLQQEDNLDAFVANVKKLTETKAYKVFSTVAPVETKLEDLVKIK